MAGKRKASGASTLAGREQTHLKQFLMKLFEDGSSPDEALKALRGRFDAEDFAKARALQTSMDANPTRDARGPRSKT